MIIQYATPEELAPVVMSAYGLTTQERTLARLVFHGLSTLTISRELTITEHTVQDHLKSIFDKTGVHSRPKLVATVLRRHYLPAGHSSKPLLWPNRLRSLPGAHVCGHARNERAARRSPAVPLRLRKRPNEFVTVG